MKKHLQYWKTMFVFLLWLSLMPVSAQALSGNKVIGTGGDYASLSAAIADINTKGVSGKLVLLINENLTETGSIEILTETLTSTNNLVIKPNAGKTPVVSFTALATSGNKGNAGLTVSGTAKNVGYITIDGSNTENGTTRDMTFELNDAAAGRYVLRFNGETDNITIKNLKIMPKAFLSTTSSGSRTYGIYCPSSPTAAADNFVVNNCQIGSETAAFYYALYKPDGGTYPYGANLEVSKNNLFAQHKGLSVWGCDGTSKINDNSISVIGHPTGSYVQNSVNGIYVESWKGTVNIYNNKIVTLKAKALAQTSLKALYGILVYYASGSGITGQTANVYNNFVSDFTYAGDAASYKSEINGITADALDQNVNIYYNTVYINNNNITTNPVYGIRVWDDVGMAVNLKNNIVVNTVDHDSAYAIYYSPNVNNCIKASNYNDFVVTGAKASVGNLNKNKYKALADWKTGSTFDANSISVNPAATFGAAGQLKSLTDLHWVSAPGLDFAGTPVTGITTDIDGDTRSTTKPYMGADEGSTLTSVENTNELPAEFSLNQNYPNPFNPSTEIEFSIKTSGNVSLKVYDALGNEITTLVNSDLAAGKYKVQFNAKNLSSGVYYYRINSGNFSASRKMMLVK